MTYQGSFNSKPDSLPPGKELRLCKIDPINVVDDTVWIGCPYEKNGDYHYFLDVYYSFDEAKKRCGERSSVLPHKVN
jgi:hypothetical protein